MRVYDYSSIEDVAVGSEPLNWDESEFNDFTREVVGLLENRSFAALDEKAHLFRSSRARFSRGGGWKIFSFYRTVSNPVESTDWEQHIALLSSWKAATDSITAKVALAESYQNWAWELRGSGFADEVDKTVWPAVEAKLQLAWEAIEEAEALEEECHGYYKVRLSMLKSNGAPRDEYEAVFAKAIEYDHTYGYFYTEKATYLLPRWSGKPGDVAKFAEEVSTSLGENDGPIVYFLIVAQLHEHKHDNFFAETGLSWRKTKKGFLLLESTHGISPLRANQFAAIAFTAKDPQATCNTHKRIKEPADFVYSLWKGRENFEKRHKLVLELMCKMPRADNQAL